ncbi:MAG TPA: shikimate dehydrogenase [Dehalococcoidia bacterium]|nr:shikimate dehydrogenase [Dehalococcoidia bacterium]
MTHNISTATGICGLIGDPVEHSISPAIHNAAFKKSGLDYIYLPFRVTSENLTGAVTALRILDLRGLNVTIPHKVAVMPLLDEIDAVAKNIGAVNTIVNDSGHLTGYNTDAAGFLKSLVAKDIDPSGKKAVILGAGGVARAISFALAGQKTEIKILSRSGSLEPAEKLAANLSQHFKSKISAAELSKLNLKQALKQADILINATSVGMSPDTYNTLVPRELLKPGMVVYDVVYNPQKTRLLEDAKNAGAFVIGGLDMLIWQGALAFELWTGIKAPLDTMTDRAVQLLNKSA